MIHGQNCCDGQSEKQAGVSQSASVPADIWPLNGHGGSLTTSHTVQEEACPEPPLSVDINMHFLLFKGSFEGSICGYDGCLSKDLLLYSSCRQTPCWSHLHLS